MNGRRGVVTPLSSASRGDACTKGTSSTSGRRRELQHVAVGGVARKKAAGLEFAAGYAAGGKKHIVKIFGEDPVEVGKRAAALITVARK